MIQDFMDWLVVNPWMIFMIIPFIFGLALFSIWRDHRRVMKLDAHPEGMTDAEYRRFNNKRFNK